MSVLWEVVASCLSSASTGPSTQTNIVRSADGISTSITFTVGGPNEITVPFNITDDLVALEPDESYNVSLSATSPVSGVTIGAFPTTQVVVEDDDSEFNSNRMEENGEERGLWVHVYS